MSKMSEESVCFAGVTLNTAAIAAIPIAVERGECPSFPTEKRPKNEVRTDEGRFALQADRNGRWLNIKRRDNAKAAGDPRKKYKLALDLN